MAGFTDTSNAWTRAWLDMQKQYMDAWTNLSRQAGAGNAATSPFGAGGTGNAWADSFAQWSRMFAQGMPGNARDVSTRLFDLGKSYLDMSERFWQFLQHNREGMPATEDWQNILQKTFGEAGKAFTFPGGATDPWSGFATLWGLPFSNWQRMATSFYPFPGEMEKALRPEHIPEPDHITRLVRHNLSLPPVGYTREWQEQQQEWFRHMLDYNHTLQAFGGLLAKVVERALELFGRRMTEKTGAGETFDGLRAVYNLWIDCGEEAYAEVAAGAEFGQLQADMVNALMRMKRHEQLMLEEVLTALNMPTRRELDTTHKRVYELQRQVCLLQDAMQGNPGHAGNTVPAGARKTATRKTATRKSATRKTAAATRRAGPKNRKD